MSINIGQLRLAMPDHDMTLTPENIAALADFLVAIKGLSVGQIQSLVDARGERVLERMRGGWSKLGGRCIHELDEETDAIVGGTFWSLRVGARVGATERIYGGLSGDTFIALWWDPKHNMIQ